MDSDKMGWSSEKADDSWDEWMTNEAMSVDEIEDLGKWLDEDRTRIKRMWNVAREAMSRASSRLDSERDLPPEPVGDGPDQQVELALKPRAGKFIDRRKPLHAIKEAAPSHSEKDIVTLPPNRKRAWQRRPLWLTMASCSVAALIVVAFVVSSWPTVRSGELTVSGFETNPNTLGSNVGRHALAGKPWTWRYEAKAGPRQVMAIQIDNVSIKKLSTSERKLVHEGVSRSRATDGYLYVIAFPLAGSNVGGDELDWLDRKADNGTTVKEQLLNMSDEEYTPQRIAKLVADCLPPEFKVRPSDIQVERVVCRKGN